MKISSIGLRSSNINDLWDLMSEANKVLKCKNQGLHESHIDGSKIIFMEKNFSSERGRKYEVFRVLNEYGCYSQ